MKINDGSNTNIIYPQPWDDVMFEPIPFPFPLEELALVKQQAKDIIIAEPLIDVPKPEISYTSPI